MKVKESVGEHVSSAIIFDIYFFLNILVFAFLKIFFMKVRESVVEHVSFAIIFPAGEEIFVAQVIFLSSVTSTTTI